jgi:hypothetical protein
MAELADKRREQFCRLRSTGMKQAEAYAKAGYRTGDRSNSSKLEQQPEIAERILELRAEEFQRQASLRLQAAELPGIDELKRARRARLRQVSGARSFPLRRHWPRVTAASIRTLPRPTPLKSVVVSCVNSTRSFPRVPILIWSDSYRSRLIAPELCGPLGEERFNEASFVAFNEHGWHQTSGAGLDSSPPGTSTGGTKSTSAESEGVGAPLHGPVARA